MYQSKAGHFAAIRYGGYSNSEKVKHYTGSLLKALKEAGKKEQALPSYYLMMLRINFTIGATRFFLK